MRIGVEYYPEHWDRSLWEQDADRMQKAGVKVVRVAEFAWSKMEPREGEYDFDWLDEVLDMFEKRDIGVVLCTPTNCPPLWAYEKYPEIRQVERSGQRTAVGIRGHRCYNSPLYRQLCEKIIRQMGVRYAKRKCVVAWQIDNEVDSNFCCCDTCAESFRNWLKAKYGTLEAVNKAFRNDVWSGSYSDWSQVMPPVGNRPMTQLNPAYMLDFCRYASESTIEYVHFQRDLLREYFPETPITTNTWLCDHMPDFYQMFDKLDFVSYDNYPTTVFPSEGYYSHAFHLDLMRGAKQKNFWIMEELSGTPGCWFPMSRSLSPGMLKGYSLQAYAHGADTVVHFRWRTAAGGAEMHWHGLLDHSNVPGRRFHEFESLCETAEKLNVVDGTQLHSDVAILMGFENDYAFRIQEHAPGMYYFEQLMAYHDAFTHWGKNVDIIDQTADLSKYKIVIAPNMYVRNEEAVTHLRAFAEQGGVVLLTHRSGVHDENNNCIMEQLPTDFASMTGAVVTEYDSIGNSVFNTEMDGETYKILRWADVMGLRGAEPIATYCDRFYAGSPSVTRNMYGKGIVYYAATLGQKPLCRAIARKLLEEAGVDYIHNLPDGVEVTVREGKGRRYTFIFNNNDQPTAFEYEGKLIRLEPFDMIVPELGGKAL